MLIRQLNHCGPSTAEQLDTITGISVSLKKEIGYIKLLKPVAFVRRDDHWMKKIYWSDWRRSKPSKFFFTVSIPEKRGSPLRGWISSSPCWTRSSTRRPAR